MIDDAHLIENLLHHELLTQGQIDQAKALQQPDVPLYNTLLEEGIGHEEDILAVAAKVLGLPYVNLTQFDYDRDAVSFLSQSIAERNTVFPLTMRQTDEGQELVLAMTDPLDIMTMDEIATHTGVDIQPILAGPRDIREAIAYAYADISQAVDDEDPFANLKPLGKPPKNPEDSWAAFFNDANAKLISDPNVPAIPVSVHEEKSLGLFDDSVGPAAPKAPEPAFTQMGTPPQPGETNMFGQFFIDDAREKQDDFNGTMLGAPFKALNLPKTPAAAPPEPQPPAELEEDSDEFDFFGEAQSVALSAESGNSLIEMSQVQHDSTQIAGFQHHEIPRSNPRAKKIASIKKKLKQPTSSGPALPSVPPMSMDFDQAMNFDSIAEEAAVAASEVMEEAHHTVMGSPNFAPSSPKPAAQQPEPSESVEAPEVPEAQEAPEPPEPQDAPAVPNALGRLQLKTIAVPNSKPSALNIVEKNKALPPVPPMPSLPNVRAQASAPPAQDHATAEEQIKDMDELGIEEISDPLSVEQDVELVETHKKDDADDLVLPKTPEVSSPNNPFGLPRAITGTSTTAIPSKPSLSDLEIVEDESELDFEPDFDFEIESGGGLDQATEANAQVTIEYAQQMQTKAPPATLETQSSLTQEVHATLDSLTDGVLLRALVRALVDKGVLTEQELLAHASDLEEDAPKASLSTLANMADHLG